jgi:anti-sigma-K factor RskA
MRTQDNSVEAMMYDDERDALAAEYVLGTLSAEERERAEALLIVDPGFTEAVQVWEHRLGELNVMVEAVEPPVDLWERIKGDIEGTEPRSEVTAPSVEPQSGLFMPLAGAGLADAPSEPSFDAVPDLLAEKTQSSDEAPATADLASTLLAADVAKDFDAPLSRPAPAGPNLPNAEVLDLDQRARRWRGIAVAASAIAALLAIYVAVAHFAPGLLPVTRQPQPILASPSRTPGVQLIAVLQQEPTPPAFLVMLDPQDRAITVRRLTAAPDSGRSYELWLSSAKSPKLASLGLIGGAEFTSRPLPANFDFETIRNANYSVSLEPGSGSPTGAPTGPMLFKGRMIEALPGAPG